MGVITVSLPEDVESLLKKIAEEEFKGKKGKISKLIQKMLFVYQLEKEKVIKEMIRDLKGKYGKIDREELWK